MNPIIAADSEQVAEEIASLKKRIDEVVEKQSHYKFRSKVAQDSMSQPQCY